MAYQDDAFQTGVSARAFQLSLAETLTLGAESTFACSQTNTITQELALPAAASFDLGGPGATVIRIRIFLRYPSRYGGFPPLVAGENEALAEPVLFFHKDSQVNLDFTVLNPDGSAYNLTGATVDLLAEPERGAVLTFSCSVVDAANGKARRTVAVGDFTAGSYQAQLRVTNGPVVVHTVYFRILVGKALA